MLKIKSLFFLGLWVSASMVFGQKKSSKNDEEKIDAKTLAYGLTTNNYSSIIGGVVLRSSTSLDFFRNKQVNQYLALEIVNIKNPVENNTYSPYGSRFIFGKKNYLFAFRPQYGREISFFDKINDTGIGLTGIIAGGPTIGVLKPYYVKYLFPKSNSPQTVAYDPDVITDPNNIVSSASLLTNAFKNLKIVPGLHLKAALNLDMATFGNSVTGIELGTLFEFYTKSPEIIASKYSKNQQAFATVYLTLYFGNKKLIKRKK